MTLICVSINDSSSLARHWGNLLVDPGWKNGETRGFSAFNPSRTIKAKLALTRCLVQVRSVLDESKPRGNNSVFLGVFFFSFPFDSS